MDKTEKIIKIKNLNVTYNKGKSSQVRALENVDLEIELEEWVIIFGPSGCGKSTLLNSIAGLETPTKGEIKVLDKEIYNLSSDDKSEYRSQTIGMVFQAFHLINSLKVVDNICLPQVFLNENSQKERRNKALALLDRFGIKEQAEKYPYNISGGQKQKVSIARALMNDPEIILADEPTGNLDSVSNYNVMNILKELNRIDKKTVIMVTHDRNHLKYADKIIHMKDGKIFKTEIIRKSKKDPKNKKDERLVLSKETKIPMDLRLLMHSFRDLSDNNIRQLLVPFKVKQTFSHLMLPITNHQVELTQKIMKDFFLGKIKKAEFLKILDKPIEEGGAGWDKRNAENFVGEVATFRKQAEEIEYSEAFKSAIKLTNFFAKKYPFRKTEYSFNMFKEVIERRLKNEISKDEVMEFLNKSSNENGLGLNRKTAQKIARDLELIILIRYLG